jgi:hypothetical protein
MSPFNVAGPRIPPVREGKKAAEPQGAEMIGGKCTVTARRIRTRGPFPMRNVTLGSKG